jgi:hypothetical protein
LRSLHSRFIEVVPMNVENVRFLVVEPDRYVLVHLSSPSSSSARKRFAANAAVR